MAVMLYIAESEVAQLLPMDVCVELTRRAFKDLRVGKAQNQARRRLAVPQGSVLHQLAGACGNYFGTKLYSTNVRHGLGAMLVLLFESDSGRALAYMEAETLGQIRTGAATGYTADLMANPQASVVGMIGSGRQARTQLAAVRAVRPIQETRVWSRRRDQLEKFCAEMNATPADSAAAAVRGADIVIAATNAADPVVETAWIKSGAFVAAIGSNQGNRRELPADLLAAAGLVAVDSLEQAKIESGDLILANALNGRNIVELKDVNQEWDPSRITIFVSLGLGLEDVAAAAYVYEQAVARKVGRPLV
jgi:ornithine cyclodeaminase/alanine dehydrogenase-like protein (mu-crystallin family)